MSIPMSASLTAESSFTPRKEFLRIPLPTPDSFALLALSSANCVRLYSFPASVVDALRHLFKLSIVLSSREDLPQGLYEFSLDGKPWTNPKALSTEKLLLDILAIIYQCGYNYLSTIDYGRENDDRLAMVFSKPAIAPNSQTANPPSPLPFSSIPANSTSLNDKQRIQRVPFALSFLSTTLMRVIAPPLHLTPAILQAVRASCPRGVVSEKKVGDNSFEFKLKGYKWFQQDTFATDSLKHILALLTSLDSHSFSLLTSLSLSNRSRVKDLWIFTGLISEDSLPVETTESNTAVSNITRLPLQTEANLPIDVPRQHKRSASEPTADLPFQHSRGNTDGPQKPQNSIPSPQPHFLRKPAPRAQVPISVLQDSNIPDENNQNLHVHMPSTISAGVENMTSVGAVAGVKPASSTPVTPPKVGGQVVHGRSGSDKVVTPPLLTTPPKQTFQSNVKDEKLPFTNDLSSPPLLGMNAFRDTAFSSNSATPTTLARSYKKDAKLDQEPKLNPSYDSSSPMFPGGWQTTPLGWRVEEETGFSEENGAASTTIHENDSHMDSPLITLPDMSLRKSEAAIIGMIASTSYTPPISQEDKPRKASENSLSSGGQGWVLVNVEGSNAVRLDDSASASNATTPRPHESKRPSSPLSTSVSAPHSPKSSALEQSPAAKAIVIMDAIEPKKKKRSTIESKESIEGGSKVFKQFFSSKKKNSVRRRGEMKAEAEAESSALKSASLRDRLRLSLSQRTPVTFVKRESKQRND